MACDLANGNIAAKSQAEYAMFTISSNRQLVETLISCLEYLDESDRKLPAVRLAECLDSLFEEIGHVGHDRGSLQ